MTPRAAGVWLLLAVTAAAALNGCAFVGLGAQVFPEKAKARFRLPDRPTIVFVDDPQRSLGSPTNASLLAETISSELVNHNAVKRLIPPHDADAYLITQGNQAMHASIDEIGRAAGSEVVVYVSVAEAKLYPEPGLLEPQATVHVKVIDVTNRRRLFPSAGDAESQAGGMLTPRGHEVKSRIGARGVDTDSATIRTTMYSQLTRRVARDVGRVFYDYTPRQPGEAFE